MLIFSFPRDFFHLVSTIQITPPTRSLCSVAQSYHLPPLGPISRHPRVAAAAGSWLAPSMTLSTRLLHVRCHLIPRLSWSMSWTFPVLLTHPTRGPHAGYDAEVALDVCPMVRGKRAWGQHDFFMTLFWRDKATLANPSLWVPSVGCSGPRNNDACPERSGRPLLPG